MRCDPFLNPVDFLILHPDTVTFPIEKVVKRKHTVRVNENGNTANTHCFIKPERVIAGAPRARYVVALKHILNILSMRSGHVTRIGALVETRPHSVADDEVWYDSLCRGKP